MGNQNVNVTNPKTGVLLSVSAFCHLVFWDMGIRGFGEVISLLLLSSGNQTGNAAL